MTELAWRNQPVFISSTFRDMHLERDHLWQFVFPWLTEFLAQRHVHLEPVDLRWGVNSVSLEHAEFKEKYILRVCLSEVSRSKPFIIVLLGNRYGWVPPRELAETVLREMGVVGHDVEGKSVTHLEIDHGVFNDDRAIAYFYFEEGQLEEAGGPDASVSEEDLRKNRELRDLIRLRFPDRVRSYRRLDLPVMGEQVRADLAREFEHAFPRAAWVASDEREVSGRESLEQFVERHIRRAITGHALANHLAGTDAWCSMVLGSSGSGRSTVFALACRQVTADASRLLLAHAFGLDASGASVEAMLSRWIPLLERRLQEPPSQPSHAGRFALVERFWQLLHDVGALERVTIMVDGVEKAAESILGQRLGWIPTTPVTGVSVVLFDLPGEIREERLQHRFPIQRFVLDGLTVAQGRQLIARICQTYHRTLPAEVIDLLLSKGRSDGSRCACNPLWLSLSTEELNLIEASDYLLTDERFPNLSAEERIVALLRDTVVGLPQDVSSLYERRFTKLGQVLGESVVRVALGGLALSDVGLAERDILAVLRGTIDASVSAADLANLRLLLRDCLTQAREGNWRFEKTSARNACLALLALEEPEDPIPAGSVSRVGIARLYWEHFRQAGDAVSEARFACVEDPGADMLYRSFGTLPDLQRLYQAVLEAYGFAPAWLTQGLGRYFIDLWEDCWRNELDVMVEDWMVIDDVATLLWDISLHAQEGQEVFRAEFLGSIDTYRQITRIMMHDYDGKGLWKTAFANRLRLSVLADEGRWAEVCRVTVDFLTALNRHQELDDSELLLVCFLACLSLPGGSVNPCSAMVIKGEIEGPNLIDARGVLLALQTLQGSDRHAELLELAQRHPLSIVPVLHDGLYLDRYAPETDGSGIGFLCWQARRQKLAIACSGSYTWLASQVEAKPLP